VATNYRGETVKFAKVRREDAFMDEIIKTLKSVPKTRLRIVRDVVDALAESSVGEKDAARLKRAGRKSLLKTTFCGIWKGRRDIGKGQSYARTLRQTLENRGDRT
jgi:hypothetical protein